MNTDWISQIKRGTLEYAVLLLINKNDRYGYELIQILNKYTMLNTNESTIYPLLRRLMKNGYLESYWQNIEEGTPPRKYYRITKSGTLYLDKLKCDWCKLIENINDIEKEWY